MVWVVKKFLFRYKVNIYPCNGNRTVGTRHSPFNSELSGAFNVSLAYHVKKTGHTCVLCLAIVPLCLHFDKSFEIPRRLALMPSLRRSLDMPKVRFPRRRSSKIQCLV